VPSHLHFSHHHQLCLTSHPAYHAGCGGDGVPQLRKDRGPGQRLAPEQAGGGRAALPASCQEGGTRTHVALHYDSPLSHVYLRSHCAHHSGAGGDDVQVRQDRGPGQQLGQEQAGGGRAALRALCRQGGTCKHDLRTPFLLKSVRLTSPCARITQAPEGTKCAECKSEDPRSGWRNSKLKAGNPLMCSKCSKAEVRVWALQISAPAFLVSSLP
jgi:hypothetical protein